MAEVTLKKYYTSRKRGGKERDKILTEKLRTEDVGLKQPPHSSIVTKTVPESVHYDNSSLENKGEKSAVISKNVKTKRAPKKKITAKTTKTNQVKLDSFFKSSPNVEQGKGSIVDSGNSTSSIVEVNTRSPKRSLPPPQETTPTKKQVVQRKLQYDDEVSKTAIPSSSKTQLSATNISIPSPSKIPLSSSETQVFSPSKTVFVSPSKRSLFSPKKLKESTPLLSPSKTDLVSPSKRSTLTPKKLTESERLDLMINQSRSKLILSPKLDKLKEALVKFSEITSKYKDDQKNSFRNTDIACSSLKKLNETTLSPSKRASAHERFQYLVNVDRTLILPSKYKLLNEMFHSMDTVSSIINNRKERITLEKVQKGVEEMMKRKFSKQILGQIVTVWPEAYDIALEKSNSRKSGMAPYELVITPKIMQEKGKKKKTHTPINPQCLIARQNEFQHKLILLVKQQHQKFLSKNNLHVPDEKIKRWHPNFKLDSVPEIIASPLPEPPESKISTAKDVLNKVKGTILPKKIEIALQSVVDESKPENQVVNKSSSSTKLSNSALKGICTDILERIRAREAADLLETMTRGPEETERLARMERLPRMVNIIWNYFVAERRVAFPVDTLVDKIIHSFESLMTAEEVKEHLKLIVKEFPGWMTFVEITKGVFVKINKSKNINEMLDNFKY